jgi:SulP family sulfate permease
VFLFSAESTPALDITGGETLEELRAELEEQGIVFAIAKPRGRFEAMLKRTGVAEKIGPQRTFPTIRAGVAAFRAEVGGR